MMTITTALLTQVNTLLSRPRSVTA